MQGKEEDKIKKITALLEKGGTMTASHHECGAPIFRYQGKTVCPVCDFQEEVKQVEQAKPQEGDYKTISRIINNKLNSVTIGLEAETELARIRERMECIELSIRILKLLKDM